MQNMREQAEALLAVWATTFNAAEIGPLTALYAKAAVLLGTSSPELYVGQETLSRYFRLGARVSIENFEVRPLSQGALLCAGFYNFVREVDATATTTPARFTFILVKEGEEWRILHHHSSALPAPRN
jgi:hypothetical protein